MIYLEDVEYEPHIVPLTIAQFREVFEFLFREGEKYANPKEFGKIFDSLDKEKNFKIWREHIDREIGGLIKNDISK